MTNPAWVSQYDTANVPNAGATACFRACRVICQRLGFTMPEGTARRWQLALSEDEFGNVRAHSPGETAEANDYLTRGGCAIVGVNYKVGSLNRDHITDHYVVAYRYVPGSDILASNILAALNPGSPIQDGHDHNYEFTFNPMAGCWQRWDGSPRITIAMVVPTDAVASGLVERP